MHRRSLILSGLAAATASGCVTPAQQQPAPGYPTQPGAGMTPTDAPQPT